VLDLCSDEELEALYNILHAGEEVKVCRELVPLDPHP
jgi:hypothetical protein